jgi:hypothetical protein
MVADCVVVATVAVEGAATGVVVDTRAENARARPITGTGMVELSVRD